MRVRDMPSALKFKVFRDLEFFCLTNNEPRVKTQPQTQVPAGRRIWSYLPGAAGATHRSQTNEVMAASETVIL